MIATILIVGLAFYWLCRETDYLSIRLEAWESIEQFDKRFMSSLEKDYEIENGETYLEYEERYQLFLKYRYAPKLVYGNIKDCEDKVDARDQWMQKEENLQARRNGEMIYQRGQKWTA